jgi:hypothetical protein
MELGLFCKYFSSSTQVLTGVFGDRKIRFTQPWGLNDPMEGTPSVRFKRAGTDMFYSLDGVTYPSEQAFYRIQILEAAVNNFGMLSLTKIPDSFEMWALYADGHRGFLIEFAENFNEKACMRSRDNRIYPVEPVEYVDDYAVDPDELYDQNVFKHQDFIRSVFLRKTKRWEHEREFRIVRPLTDCTTYEGTTGYKTSYRDHKLYLFDLDPECIASVIFGAHMSSEAKHYIYSQVRETHINLFQAFICPAMRDDEERQGRLVLIPLIRFGAPEVILDTPPHHFSSIDGDPRQEKRYQSITTLAELPYYERFSGIVERYREAVEATGTGAAQDASSTE